jgi:hypothetical protein
MAASPTRAAVAKGVGKNVIGGLWAGIGAADAVEDWRGDAPITPGQRSVGGSNLSGWQGVGNAASQAWDVPLQSILPYNAVRYGSGEADLYRQNRDIGQNAYNYNSQFAGYMNRQGMPRMSASGMPMSLAEQNKRPLSPAAQNLFGNRRPIDPAVLSQAAGAQYLPTQQKWNQTVSGDDIVASGLSDDPNMGTGESQLPWNVAGRAAGSAWDTAKNFGQAAYGHGYSALGHAITPDAGTSRQKPPGLLRRALNQRARSVDGGINKGIDYLSGKAQRFVNPIARGAGDNLSAPIDEKITAHKKSLAPWAMAAIASPMIAGFGNAAMQNSSRRRVAADAPRFQPQQMSYNPNRVMRLGGR